MFWPLWGVLVAVLLFCVVVVMTNLLIIRSARPSIIDSADIPSAQVAIILAAETGADGTPSPMLSDRLDAGLGLYYLGKVEKLLLTAGDPATRQDEVGSMREYLLGKGVPDEDIVLDRDAGDIYQALYRAKATFDVKEALLVTQVFQLARSVYIARNLGIDATGVPADQHPYVGEWKYFVRDWLSGVKTLIQLHVTHPQPQLGLPHATLTP